MDPQDRSHDTLCRDITDAELDVLKAVADGRSMEAIARDLHLSERTVRRRIRTACDRVGVDTSIEVVVWAVRHGLM